MRCSADHQSPTSWVGDWGRCTRCDALCTGGLCSICLDWLVPKELGDAPTNPRLISADEWLAANPIRVTRSPEPGVTEAPLDRLVRRSNFRPLTVEVRRASDTTPIDPREAVLTIPDDARPNLVAVASTIASIASLRLIWGDSRRFALRHVALGRDQLRELIPIYSGGPNLDRKTIANILLELEDLGVLQRVGQLHSWIDAQPQNDESIIKTGAFVYSLAVGMREVGSLAQAEFLRRLPITPLSATVRGSAPKSRLQGCLDWAVNNAVQGNRNAIGAWLMFRCKDIDVNYPTAKRTMESYHRNVDQGRPLYTWAEADRTLRSAYRVRKSATPGEWL